MIEAAMVGFFGYNVMWVILTLVVFVICALIMKMLVD